MLKSVGLTDLQRQLRIVLAEVIQENVPYVLTQDSQPQAVIVPYQEFIRLQALQEQDVLRRVDALVLRMKESNAHYSEAEVAAEVEAAIQEVRRKENE